MLDSLWFQRWIAEAFSLCFAFLDRKIARVNCKLCKRELRDSLECNPKNYIKRFQSLFTLLCDEHQKPPLIIKAYIHFIQFRGCKQSYHALMPLACFQYSLYFS